MTRASVGSQSESTFAPEPLAQRIGLYAQRVAVALGLGILTATQPCHGYANGCSCEGCQCRADRYALLRALGTSRSRAAAKAKRFAAGIHFEV